MTATRNAITAWQKRVRRGLRKLVSRAFAAVGGHGGSGRMQFDRSAIRSVLVVRVNNRMGNTLFMTPLLAALHESLPHAAINRAPLLTRAAR